MNHMKLDLVVRPDQTGFAGEAKATRDLSRRLLKNGPTR